MRAHVCRDADCVRIGQGFGGQPDLVGVRGVADQYRPGGNSGAPVRGVARHFVFQQPDGGVDGGRCRGGVVRAAFHPGSHPAADAHAFEALDDGIEVADGARFQEAGGAAFQHLQCGELCGQPFVPRGVRLEAGDHPTGQLFTETGFDLIGNIAARQRVAGDVDVRIDESRRYDEAARVDGFPCIDPPFRLDALADEYQPVAAERQGAVPDDAAPAVHGHQGAAGEQRIGCKPRARRVVTSGVGGVNGHCRFPGPAAPFSVPSRSCSSAGRR